MPETNLSCANCATPIVDTATLVRRGNVAYCCSNCARHAEGGAGTTLVCAHCGTPIVDILTETERDNRIFCCPNCAQVDAGIGIPHEAR
jgi:hypothetical protein